jgi:tetratricopeptide (TPR) repeat protein
MALRLLYNPSVVRTGHTGNGGAQLGMIVGGRYRVTKLLGAGGMGKVFRVEELASGETLALKVFGARSRRLSARSQLLFRREFHTMARLSHPCILRVHDYGIDEELGPYYTMEFLDGADLRRRGTMPPEEVCRVLRDVASALALLHVRRLVHRDVAPSNIHRTSDGRTKLFDFGLLATVGLVGEVAGTPPFVAPESLRRIPIDHRADLFGLGALAYRLLTGKHAFPAKRLEDLEPLWRSPPPAPSSMAAGVPQPLDDLVLSLLSIDPLARPRSAAEVIDRLGAITPLPPMPQTETARGYLVSAALVGREREIDRFKRNIARADSGKGRAVLIEALSGAGKSRLLREVGLEAQLAGATVLSAGSEQAGRGPYGLLRELARQLLAAAPEEALEASQPRAPIIAGVFPELRDRLGPVTPPPAAADPAEERMRVQSQLTSWFLALAARRTLVLLVDDIQRCDEASAAVLAALAHSAPAARLLLVAALRTDEPVVADAAVCALRDGGMRLKLRGLGASDVETLVGSLFGTVPHLRRLAQQIHDIAGGLPLHCLELLHHLVESGTIRYVDDIWVLPEDLSRADLPDGLAGAMQARIAGLSAGAQRLAQALSVHRGRIPLELCVQVAAADPLGEEEVFAALDELELREILVGSGRSYRFRHDGVREALVASLDDDRSRQLHLAVGVALAAGGVAPEEEAEVGWHLLQGGEAQRGAELLRRAGLRLYNAQSFRDAIAPLEAALDVFEREGKATGICVDLRHKLVMAGCMFDRQVALRYVDSTVAAYRSLAGVTVAGRFGRILGRHLGLAIGIGAAFLRWLFTPRRRRTPGPLEALRTLFVVVGYAATVYSISFDIPKLRALLDLVRPLAIFSRRIPYAVYLLTCNLLAFPLGRLGTVRRNTQQLLRILETDRVTPISDIDRRTGEGGARYLLALMDVAEGNPQFLDQLERLEALDLRFYEIGALQARLCYHRWRGEEEMAARIQAETEVMFVQLGSVWQMEAWLPVVCSHTFALTGDVLGLKNTIETLDRLCQQGFQFQAHLELARGEYHRERGELEASSAALERALALLDEGEGLIRPAVLAALAETLLAAGELERAAAVARQGVALGEDPERGQAIYRLRSARALALIDAAAGETARATAALERLSGEATTVGNPTVCGAMHEARAWIALDQGDEPGFRRHCAEADRWFRRTRNPVLVARGHLLASTWDRAEARRTDAAARPRPTGGAWFSAGQSRAMLELMVSEEANTFEPPDLGGGELSALFTSCRGNEERVERALDVLVQASLGVSGYLYLLQGETLTLAAPRFGAEPPADVPPVLWQAIDDAEPVSRQLVSEATTLELDGPQPLEWGGGSQRWIPVVLTVGRAGRRRVVGAAAILAGELPLQRPDPGVVAAVARGLYEAGDATVFHG